MLVRKIATKSSRYVKSITLLYNPPNLFDIRELLLSRGRLGGLMVVQNLHVISPYGTCLIWPCLCSCSLFTYNPVADDMVYNGGTCNRTIMEGI